MYGTAPRFVDELAAFAALDEETSRRRRPKARRHTLPPEQLTFPFSLRLTPAERELVVLATQLAGTAAPATWARTALIAAARAQLEAAASQDR